MPDNSILTPESPRWPDFVEALGIAVMAERCDSRSCRLAVRLMQTMGGIDLEGSLKYFAQHGGLCDCEILMNVDVDDDAGADTDA